MARPMYSSTTPTPTSTYYCALSKLKQWLFAFIVLLMPIGTCIFSFGVLLLLDTRRVLKYASTIVPFNVDIQHATGMLNNLILALVIIGSLAVFLGIIGCFAVATESRRLLMIFFVTLFVVFFGLLSISFLLIKYQNKMADSIRQSLAYELALEIPDGLLLAAHQEMGCCGIDSMATCDRDYPSQNSICLKSSEACKLGCQGAIWGRVFLPKLRAFLIVSTVSCISVAITKLLSLIVYLRLSFNSTQLQCQSL